MQTLLFEVCLPTCQNGVKNRDKAYLIWYLRATGLSVEIDC